MAFAAARSVLRVANVARPSLQRASFAPRAHSFRQVAPATFSGVRTYVTANKYSRDEVLERLDKFHCEVLSANWADYLYLVYNGPFWEAELEKLTTIVQPYLHEKTVGAKFTSIQEMMDVLYQCEDVRDHLNELAEMKTRASGFMGTGFSPAPQIENMDEHAKLCSEAYANLLQKHPDFKPKIEQTVGHGLAILRSKHKFRFAADHRYFY
mmetsp:Transcript_78636/g.124174  ORF Transcript_78636/g.124174 Transcript_78636/m.124174 type:complete len:210 (+) Transcript_78636:78-707(+)